MSRKSAQLTRPVLVRREGCSGHDLREDAVWFMTGRGNRNRCAGCDPRVWLILLDNRPLRQDVLGLTCWLMNKTLNRSMALFDAAGLAAALTAAPVCSPTGQCYFRDTRCEKGQE